MPDQGPVRLSVVARLIGWTAVLIAMLVLVVGGLVAAQRSWTRTRSAHERMTDAVDAARYSCLEKALRRQIPAGATVVDDGAGLADFQRIAEELTPGYRFTTRARAGDYRVSFLRPGPCNGVGVKVVRVP